MAITATPQDILIHIQVIMIRILEKLDRYFKSNWRLAVLDLEKGRWMIEPKPAIIPYLKAQNAKGRHILMQPKEPQNYLLADDLSHALLCAHHKQQNGAFKPGRMIVETSPHNFHVWIHFTHPLSLDQKRFLLRKLRSDPGADPNNRFGRCPGFRNRKEKHRGSQGHFPLAKLIWVDWAHQTRIPEGLSFPRRPQNATVSHLPSFWGVCQFLSRDRYQKDNESRTDFSYALALIRKGFSDDQIRSRILAERSNWNNHRTEKKQMLYIDRTIGWARKIVG